MQVYEIGLMKKCSNLIGVPIYRCSNWQVLVYIMNESIEYINEKMLLKNNNNLSYKIDF